MAISHPLSNTPILEPFASMSVDLVGSTDKWANAEGTHSRMCSFHVGPYAPILMVILFSNTIGICMDDIDSWWSCFPTQLGYLWWWSNRNGARGFSMEMKHPLELTWYVHCSNSQGPKSSILEPILTDKPLQCDIQNYIQGIGELIEDGSSGYHYNEQSALVPCRIVTHNVLVAYECLYFMRKKSLKS